jgi:hypothetical protein
MQPGWVITTGPDLGQAKAAGPDLGQAGVGRADLGLAGVAAWRIGTRYVEQHVGPSSRPDLHRRRRECEQIG